MILAEIPAVITQLLVQAREGDTGAAKILMDKILPNLKPVSEAITFDIADNDNLATMSQSIIDSIARGELPADTGAQIVGAIAAQAKIVEFTEMEARILALEGGKA
jgi:hypothetical protein